MQGPSVSARPLPLVLLSVGALVIVTMAGFAAFQSRSLSAPGAAPSAAPQQAGKPGGKKEHKTEVEVTLTGLLGSGTTAEGGSQYTLTVGSQVLALDAGPSWFYTDKQNPLAPYVGKTVTVVGEQAQGGATVDVRSVDGTTIREPGKPPWAGGWKRVGKLHPGWTQEKWDRWQAKQADLKAKFSLDCWPPGWCKDAAGKPVTPSATEAPPNP